MRILLFESENQEMLRPAETVLSKEQKTAGKCLAVWEMESGKWEMESRTFMLLLAIWIPEHFIGD